MLIFLLSIFCIIPAIAGSVNYLKFDERLRVYVLYLWLSVIAEIIANYSLYNKIIFSINYNLFIILGLIIYLKIFVNYKTISSGFAVAIFCILCCIKCIDYYIEPKWTVLNAASAFDCLTIIFFSIKTLQQQYLLTDKFSLNSVLFVLLCVTIFLNLFDVLNTILGWLFFVSTSFTKLTTNIFLVANIISYSVITYAFLCLPTNKK